MHGRWRGQSRISRPTCAKAPGSLVDIGCGNGMFLEVLRERYPRTRLIGQELDAECVDICRDKGFEATLDGLTAVSAETIDVATMLDVAEHVRDPAASLADTRKLLRSGGLLYLHTPRRSLWDSLFLSAVRMPGLGRVARAWLQSRVSIYHLRLWSDRGLRTAVENAGFRVTSYHAELELSWPLEMYFDLYLRENLRLPGGVVRAATRLGELVFVRLRLLRNKAIVTAVAV